MISPVKFLCVFVCSGFLLAGCDDEQTAANNVDGLPLSASDGLVLNCMDDRDIAMLDAVNKARSKARSCGSAGMMQAVSPLQWDCTVEKAAQIHNDDMAANRFLNHTGSDGSSPGGRLARVNYDNWGWAENIAQGQANVAEVMDGWLKSDGHCANIMSPTQKVFGSAYNANPGSRFQTYWTQLFAIPAGG